MGLRQKIQEEVAAAMDGSLADTVTQFTYYEIAHNVYGGGDGGGVVATQDDVGITARGIFSYIDPTRKEREADILEPFDLELLVLQNEIAVDGFEINSHIESTEYGKFRIARFVEDPARATWILYLKRVGK